MDKKILSFVAHKYDCDITQPMWHKGPCDCGLYDLLDELHRAAFSNLHPINITTLKMLYDLQEASPYLVADWEKNRLSSRLPDILYMCQKCGNPFAEKQEDVYGWDGHCRYCGMIAQVMVGPEFIRKLGKTTEG